MRLTMGINSDILMECAIAHHPDGAALLGMQGENYQFTTPITAVPGPSKGLSRLHAPTAGVVEIYQQSAAEALLILACSQPAGYQPAAAAFALPPTVDILRMFLHLGVSFFVLAARHVDGLAACQEYLAQTQATYRLVRYPAEHLPSALAGAERDENAGDERDENAFETPKPDVVMLPCEDVSDAPPAIA